jgi:Zn-dependent oligopeptidase
MSLFKSGSIKVAFGFGLGVIAAEAVKQVLPAFRSVGKPLLKAAVKSGVILARDGRARFEEFRETLADLRAEAEAELDQAAPRTPPYAGQTSDTREEQVLN